MSSFHVNISGKADLEPKLEEARSYLMDLFSDVEYDSLEIRVLGEGEFSRPSNYLPYTRFPMFRSSVDSAPPIHSFASTWLFTDREGADAVLKALGRIIEKYEVATMSDFKELVGASATHVDYKWVWHSLDGVELKQVRDGYQLTLPTPIPLKNQETDD